MINVGLHRMKNCFIIGITTIVIVITACTKKPHIEVEPNNDFATAGEIVPGARLRGYMDAPNDRDFFLYNAQENGIIDVRLSGSRGLNLAIRIWKGRGKPELIKMIDDNRKSSPERFANLAVEPGPWFVEIFSSDRDPKKGNREDYYELELKAREIISEEAEPNDSTDQAGIVTPGVPVAGYYSPAYNRMNSSAEFRHREEDWYRVDCTLDYGSPALMEVNLTGVTGINPVLRLIDGDGNVIAMADNGGAGEGERIIGAGIRESGTYYIMIAALNYMINNDEPYSLGVILREHDRGAELEKNDDLDSVNVMVDNHITGRMNHPDDIDFFLYNTDAPALYRIEVRPPEDMDASIAFFNRKRERVIDVNSAGRGRREVYPNFHSDSDFYIAVSSKTGTPLPAGDYILTVTPLRNAENYEREPNNEVSRANSIPGTTVSGYTSYPGDKDYFLLAFNSRINERFEVTGVKGGEIKVSVTDPLGYIIRSVDVRGNSKIVFNETIDKKGYLIVESLSEDYDNPYTIIFGGGK